MSNKIWSKQILLPLMPFLFFAVLIVCVAVICFAIWRIIKTRSIGRRVLLVLLCFLMVGVFLVDVLSFYPFDITISLEKIAETEVQRDLDYYENDEIDDHSQLVKGKSISRQWWCIYDGPTYSSLPSDFKGKVEIDLNKYTYVVSLEREIEKLTVNVKDHRGDTQIGALLDIKYCKAKLSEEKTEGKIYVYRCRKIRMDNPFLTKMWDGWDK